MRQRGIVISAHFPLVESPKELSYCNFLKKNIFRFLLALFVSWLYKEGDCVAEPQGFSPFLWCRSRKVMQHQLAISKNNFVCNCFLKVLYT
jgi:hypothetical protein